MSGLKVIVFLGTVRENRVGIRVANFILNHLKETSHDVELFGKDSSTLTENDITIFMSCKGVFTLNACTYDCDIADK